MATINLLPWREALRQKRNKEYQYTLIVTALIGVLLAGLAWLIFNAKLNDQLAANQQITAANNQKDEKLKVLTGLQDKRKELADRIKAVQSLQGSRPVLVRLFDELTRATPSKLYLTKFQRAENHFTIEGYAESAVVVSELLRNLDTSLWYQNAFMTSFENKDEQNKGTSATNTQAQSLAPRPEDSYGKFVVTADLQEEDSATDTSKTKAGVK